MLAILTFPLATTSVFNYKEIDKVLLANNPPVDVPVTEFRSDRNITILGIIKIHKSANEIRYQLNGKFVNLKELALSLSEYKNYASFRPGIWIYVPKDLPMRELRKLENQLWQVNIWKVSYVTINPQPEFNSRLDMNWINKRLREPDQKVLEYENESLGLPPPVPSKRFRFRKEFFQNNKIVTVKITDKYQVDGLEIPKESLVPYFKRNIGENTYFNFQFDESVLFEDYIHGFAAYLQALEELRKEDQRIHRIDEWGPWLDENNNFATREDYNQDQDRLKDKYWTAYFENFDLEQAE